jgi:hypothetical protein
LMLFWSSTSSPLPSSDHHHLLSSFWSSSPLPSSDRPLLFPHQLSFTLVGSKQWDTRIRITTGYTDIQLFDVQMGTVGGWLGDQELLAVVGSSCSSLGGRLMLPTKTSDHFLWQLFQVFHM